MIIYDVILFWGGVITLYCFLVKTKRLAFRLSFKQYVVNPYNMKDVKLATCAPTPDEFVIILLPFDKFEELLLHNPTWVELENVEDSLGDILLAIYKNKEK